MTISNSISIQSLTLNQGNENNATNNNEIKSFKLFGQTVYISKNILNNPQINTSQTILLDKHTILPVDLDSEKQASIDEDAKLTLDPSEHLPVAPINSEEENIEEIEGPSILDTVKNRKRQAINYKEERIYIPRKSKSKKKKSNLDSAVVKKNPSSNNNSINFKKTVKDLRKLGAKEFQKQEKTSKEKDFLEQPKSNERVIAPGLNFLVEAASHIFNESLFPVEDIESITLENSFIEEEIDEEALLSSIKKRKVNSRLIVDGDEDKEILENHFTNIQPEKNLAIKLNEEEDRIKDKAITQQPHRKRLRKLNASKCEAKVASNENDLDKEQDPNLEKDLEKGRVLLKKGQAEKALKIFSSYKSKYFLVNYYVCKCYLKLGKTKQALDLIDESLKRKLKEPDLISMQAAMATKYGKWYEMGKKGLNKNLVEAQRYYHLACDLGCKEAYYNLGVIEDKNKNYEKAKEYYLNAIEKGFHSAYYNLALLFLEPSNKVFYNPTTGMNHLRTCIDKLEEQEELHEDEKLVLGQSYYQLACLYEARREFKLAWEAYNQAIDKDCVDAFYNVGIWWENGTVPNSKQDYDQAAIAFKKGRKLGSHDAALKLGSLHIKNYLKDSQKEIAKKCFEEALASENNLTKKKAQCKLDKYFGEVFIDLNNQPKKMIEVINLIDSDNES